MGLVVSRLGLSHWRNLDDLVLEPSEGVTVLVGPNAAGKTNTVEALQYLTAGVSFRHPAARELVAQGAREASAAARLTGDGRVIDVEPRVEEERKSFLRNGKRVRASSLPGTLLSVLFCPDDLTLVKGPARARRGEIDGFGSQANAGYRKVALTYARSIEQRNRLLRDGCDPMVLDAWDDSVACGAATLLYHRLSLFGRLRAIVGEVYERVSGGELLEVRYVPTLPSPDGDAETLLSLSRDELRERMAAALAASRETDMRRGATTVGPHRDDLAFLIDGRDARTFGSQGQQRTVALAWKMAEVRLCRDLLGERPLLLLDDVMSELDAERRVCVTRFVEGGIQTVITTTNLGYFTDELLSEVKVVSYGG